MSRIAEFCTALFPPAAAMGVASIAAALVTPALPWHDAVGLTCVGLMTFLVIDRITGHRAEPDDTDLTEEP